MTTELTTLSAADDAAILEASGQPTSEGGVYIPRMYINSEAEDDDGNRLPIGYFAVTLPAEDGKEKGDVIFAKEVHFRPLINTFQYLEWNNKAGEYANRSIKFKRWQEEALDLKGGVRCGKVKRDEWDNLPPAEAARQKSIKCYRFLYGVATFINAVNVKGEKLDKIENIPVVWKTTGLSFQPLQEVLDMVTKKKMRMVDLVGVLTSTREKRGTNTFYLPNFALDYDTVHPVTEDIIETMKVFLEAIHRENEFIVSQWKKAVKMKEADPGHKVADHIEALAADFAENDDADDLDDGSPVVL